METYVNTALNHTRPREHRAGTSYFGDLHFRISALVLFNHCKSRVLVTGKKTKPLARRLWMRMSSSAEKLCAPKFSKFQRRISTACTFFGDMGQGLVLPCALAIAHSCRAVALAPDCPAWSATLLRHDAAGEVSCAPSVLPCSRAIWLVQSRSNGDVPFFFAYRPSHLHSPLLHTGLLNSSIPLSPDPDLSPLNLDQKLGIGARKSRRRQEITPPPGSVGDACR
jgi:hypothetical protein